MGEERHSQGGVRARESETGRDDDHCDLLFWREKEGGGGEKESEGERKTGRETDREGGARETETEAQDRNASKRVKWHVIKMDTAIRVLQTW